ncbi:MAG: hypothetical protein HPY76_12050 [Anaerolineae bacterium]|nr:hypothetical protein [Anaerolineae bacterium]
MTRCQFPQCKAACCLYGVWMDAGEKADVLEHLAIILPHMPEGSKDLNAWWDGKTEQDPFTPTGEVIHTAVLAAPGHYGGSACVFLRSDHKCALQVAGQQAGLHPWRFKPFYCVLHPLDLDDEGRITLDETSQLLDEPASCLQACEREGMVKDIFEAELRYLLGEAAFRNGAGLDIDPGRID